MNLTEKYGEYIVKSVNSLRLHDHLATTCNVYRGKKVVGHYTDDGMGNPVIEWVSKAEETACIEFCKTQPSIKFPWGDTTEELSFTPEHMISDLCDSKDNIKNIKRWCKTHICFTKPRDPDSIFKKHLKGYAFSESIATKMRQIHGNDIVILNGKF